MAIEVPLSKGYVTIVDDEDVDLAKFNWHVDVCKPRLSYAIRTIHSEGKDVAVRLHRIVLSRMMGRPLQRHEYCDHINGDCLDNRRANLRLATSAENTRNARISKRSRTGLKGVSVRHDGVFRAQITVNRQRIHLGYYASADDAHEAYVNAARELHGEFANDGVRSLAFDQKRGGAMEKTA